MQTAMSNGVSALMSFQTALDVEANNAANTQSTAYKSDSVSFSDIFYQNKVGLGVSADTPKRDFSQGALKPTNSEYDFAIAGEGFFTVEDANQPGSFYYTRAGEFYSDKNNNLVDSNGMLVYGIAPTVTGDMITSEFTKAIATTVIKTEDSTISHNSYVTDYVASARATGATGVSGTNYKSVDTNITDIEALIYAYKSALEAYGRDPKAGESAQKFQAEVEFPLTNATAGYTIEVVVDGVKFQQRYDTNVENTLRLLSDKINEIKGITSSVDTTTGIMTIESMIPGQNMSVTKAKLNDNELWITTTQEESGSGKALVDARYTELESLLDSVGAKIATNKSEIIHPESGSVTNLEPIVLDLNLLGMNSTLYEKLISGDPDTVAAYPEITSEDGNLYLNDGDSRFLVGMLVPVTFTDKSILDPVGDNLYQNKDTDVEPFYIENMADVRGRFVEFSNVDLSVQLVNLVAFQKAFEANSKSISTSDEMMKTALALKTT
jgi:flagellar hook protein FlgE